jgi:hypothetical protein
MAFEAQLAADRKDCIPVGQQLLANKNVDPSAAARKALLAGQVDLRLLVCFRHSCAKCRLSW